MILIYLFVGIVCAILCANIAKSKNREAGLWGVLGFFFGLIALIIIAVLDKREPGQVVGSPAPALPGHSPAQAPARSTADEIAQWKKLLDEGAITEDEFLAKKGELLGRA